ncbi:MAG: hypothetical protein V4732_11435 [Pseudomonadota bacterium]
MKKILFLIMGFSCSAFAVDDNPIAPPRAEIVDRFGVNLQTGQLARTLSTVSIGGELGLSHSVQLYTDLLSDNNRGFIDAYAGSVTPKKISENIIDILTSGSGDSLAILVFRDKATYEYDHTKRLSVMRAYGPAGSQDFLVYQNGVVNRDASATSGQTYRAVGDYRHTLTESADKSYLTWVTPDGIESKYGSPGRRLLEVTYPNGYKVRVSSIYNGVTTNTGFMLKYQLPNQGLGSRPDQFVAINLANQYCSANATTCTTAGWPTATFTWPINTPNVFRQPGLPPSSYLAKMTTGAGITDIQYQPENVCLNEFGNEDAGCAAIPPGGTKWYPRLRSIKTPESNIPNYQYTYKNKGKFFSTGLNNEGFAYTYTYWSLLTTSGQILNATLNGTDSQGYSGPTINSPRATTTWGNGETWVESSQFELNVIESVVNKKSGTYLYHKDLRHFVEKFYPVAGRGPNQHYFYEAPRGNLSKINAMDASGNETLLQEASGYAADCTRPKTCNKPTSVKDARGNVTEYEYDSLGRFGNPIKITVPADKNGARATTIYNYTPMYAYYKKDGEAITQDPDPVWMLSSELTCHKKGIDCTDGSLDMMKTTYYYGPQSSAQANNLLLRGKSVEAESNGSLTIRVMCYEYDKYGNKIGETSPKGNSTNLQSCP